MPRQARISASLVRNTAGRKKNAVEGSGHTSTTVLFKHQDIPNNLDDGFPLTLRHTTVSEAQRLQASQIQYAEIYETEKINFF